MHVVFVSKNTSCVFCSFLELKRECKEGFKRCCLCKSDIAYNGQDPRRLGVQSLLMPSIFALEKNLVTAFWM